MPGPRNYIVETVMSVRSVHSGAEASLVKKPPLTLDTSAGRFELAWVALGPERKKKFKKTYVLKHPIGGRRTAKGKGTYGVFLSLRTGKVIVRGVVPDYLKARIAALTTGRS